MLSTIAILLVLGGLIFFHELGHFVFAKSFGVGVKTFSLGFGPKILGFRRGLTNYQVSAVPLGGYVHMVGEGPNAELPEGFDESHSFAQKSAWKRMVIVAAGPVFNFILAWLIYWVLLWSHGQMMVLPEIGTVNDGSPAAEAGIRPGDTIVSVNGRDVDYWSEMSDAIRKSGGAPVNIKIAREDGEHTFKVKPEVHSHKNIFGETVESYMVGVIAAGTTRTIELGPAESMVQGMARTYEMVKLTVMGIVKLIERVVPLESVGGPIMIAQLVSEQAHEGLANVLALTAIISVNLGLINLLPIPVLDGGHILFFGLEAITGRRIPEKWQAITTRFGIAALVALMALALYNDLVRIFWPSAS
jgi:regulator of sigma E protease